jgi:ATP-dependent Lhr-like helicase
MSLESLSGGFSAVYPVLRAMEDAGKIRRGHFVDGFSGAQFAFVAAVDRLRATRMQPDAPQVQVLAACDPANPYGALLPWPEPSCELARPRRAAGASVALIDGDPALFLDSGAQRVWTFSPSEPERREEAIVRAARALGRAAHLARRRGLRIQSVDGEPALHSPLVDVFARAGYRRGYNALELDRFDDT